MDCSWYFLRRKDENVIFNNSPACVLVTFTISFLSVKQFDVCKLIVFGCFQDLCTICSVPPFPPVICPISMQTQLAATFLFYSLFYSNEKATICHIIYQNRSDEGLTFETSASESLYGGLFTLSTQSIKPNYLVILPPTQHHSFFRNLPPLYLNLGRSLR